MSHLRSGLTYVITEKGRKVAENYVLTETGKHPVHSRCQGNFCLYLAAAEHPKTVFIQRFMDCLIIGVLRDEHNRKTISFLFGISAPKHISTVL